MNEQKVSVEAAQAMAKFLEVIGDQSVGRGVYKTNLTPQQQLGLFPQNPSFFGVQGRNAVPYDRILSDGQRLAGVLKGYEELKPHAGGAVPLEVGNVVANAQRSKWLVSQAMDKTSRQSIYTGVPKNTAINLMEINLMRRRENNLYAFQ